MRIHDVAAYLLNNFETGISTMKLQKLCYFTQGWSLALTNEALFDEDFEAWSRGPVSPELYAVHRGRFSVDSWDEGDAGQLTSINRLIVGAVLDNYGALSGLQLSELTHADHSPWALARERENVKGDARSTALIKKEDIKIYFKSLLLPQPA